MPLTDPPHPPMTDSHYQRETERLTRETERQRREIVLLRRDLAGALTQYVRAGIIIHNLNRFEAAAVSNEESDEKYAAEIAEAQLAMRLALKNWAETELGTPGEILARIDLLSQPIPEDP